MAWRHKRSRRIEHGSIAPVRKGIYQVAQRIVKEEAVALVRQAVADAPIGQFTQEACEIGIIFQKVGASRGDHRETTRG
jgi:hypothetical protein